MKNYNIKTIFLMSTLTCMTTVYATNPASQAYVDLQVKSLQTQINNMPAVKTYTAGTGIAIIENTISNTAPAIAYTAGTGINISGTTISATPAGPSTFPCTTANPQCGAFASDTNLDGSMVSSGTNNPLDLPACGTGVTGAACGDSYCDAEGKSRFGAKTAWVAWLSTTARNAKNQIMPNAHYYRANSSDLIFTTASDGTPQYTTTPYLYDVFSASSSLVWTGTTTAGDLNPF